MERAAALAFVTLLLAFPWVLQPLAAGPPAEQGPALRLGQVSTIPNSAVKVPLTLDSADAPIQGLVAVFQWEAERGAAVGLETAEALADADLVSLRADPSGNFMILGVVMDNDGQGTEAIPAGEGILLAEAEIQCLGLEEQSFPLQFIDGVHALVDGGPALDNIVIDDGLSVGVGEGLLLEDGQVACQAGATALKVESTQTDPTDPESPFCADTRILLSSSEPVAGFVTAICHEEAVLTLESILLGEDSLAAGIDFQQENLFPDGGTLGVIVDLLPPFGNIIPAGEDLHIATYRYCCSTPPAAGEADVVTPLVLCDLQLGSPPLDNLVVIGSTSVTVDAGLVLEDGEFRCVAPAGGAEEICSGGEDEDGDGLVDCDDPDCAAAEECVPAEIQQEFACGSRQLGEDGLPQSPRGVPGSTIDVCFYIKNPEDNRPPDSEIDHIQGFSMALSFCCESLEAGSTLDVSGTVLEAVGADFLSVQADNDEADGDGCELIIGLLVDAFPPFDGGTIPPLPGYQSVGCIDFAVNESAACGSSCTLQFEDGLNGNGKVPVKNLVSVENFARVPKLNDCEVLVVPEPVFFRGDCNFSGQQMGMAVDIADVASIVSFLMADEDWVFEPPCHDACDCNDDGGIDLADALCIIRYILENEIPPAPGPGLSISTGSAVPTDPGFDPTADKLDCSGGEIECP